MIPKPVALSAQTARCLDRGNGSADNIRASGSYSPQKKAEDMTAPTTRATPKIALDQRAASRHDTALMRQDYVVHKIEGPDEILDRKAIEQWAKENPE